MRGWRGGTVVSGDSYPSYHHPLPHPPTPTPTPQAWEGGPEAEAEAETTELAAEFAAELAAESAAVVKPNPAITAAAPLVPNCTRISFLKAHSLSRVLS
jgi:hypothetical protein